MCSARAATRDIQSGADTGTFPFERTEAKKA
jgi:hypothetical protein